MDFAQFSEHIEPAGVSVSNDVSKKKILNFVPFFQIWAINKESLSGFGQRWDRVSFTCYRPSREVLLSAANSAPDSLLRFPSQVRDESQQRRLPDPLYITGTLNCLLVSLSLLSQQNAFYDIEKALYITGERKRINAYHRAGYSNGFLNQLFLIQFAQRESKGQQCQNPRSSFLMAMNLGISLPTRISYQRLCLKARQYHIELLLIKGRIE